jgi:hypothetical protein
MAITHDPDFSPAIAQLVAQFNRCADGHSMVEVMEASANMLSASLHNYARAAGLSDVEFEELAKRAAIGVFRGARENWKRVRKPTDVVVGQN